LTNLLLWRLPQPSYEKAVAVEPLVHIILTVIPLTTSSALRLRLKDSGDIRSVLK
jgi:hypothetical protein